MLGARVSEPLPEKETEEKEVRGRLGGREAWGWAAVKLPLLQDLGKGTSDPPKMIRKQLKTYSPASVP